MEKIKRYTKGKGGRPQKVVKRDQLLGAKCTLVERKAIEYKAKIAGLTTSEYLREVGLTGKIDMRKKVLPKEVLQATGTLNHMAANLNQIAKKRNSLDELNAIERAELQQLSRQFKELAGEIKKYVQ